MSGGKTFSLSRMLLSLVGAGYLALAAVLGAVALFARDQMRVGALLLAVVIAAMAWLRARRKIGWSRSRRIDVATLTLLALGITALAIALPNGR